MLGAVIAVVGSVSSSSFIGVLFAVISAFTAALLLVLTASALDIVRLRFASMNNIEFAGRDRSSAIASYIYSTWRAVLASIVLFLRIKLAENLRCY